MSQPPPHPSQTPNSAPMPVYFPRDHPDGPGRSPLTYYASLDTGAPPPLEPSHPPAAPLAHAHGYQPPPPGAWPPHAPYWQGAPPFRPDWPPPKPLALPQAAVDPRCPCVPCQGERQTEHAVARVQPPPAREEGEGSRVAQLTAELDAARRNFRDALELIQTLSAEVLRLSMLVR